MRPVFYRVQKHFAVSDMHVIPSPFFPLESQDNIATIRRMDHQTVCGCSGVHAHKTLGVSLKG